MIQATSPYQAQAPSGRRLLVTSLIAVGGAALALVTVVLPAEYGIDPTGVGDVLGLTSMGAPSRTIEIVDVVGGNESVVEAEIPDFG